MKDARLCAWLVTVCMSTTGSRMPSSSSCTRHSRSISSCGTSHSGSCDAGGACRRCGSSGNPPGEAESFVDATPLWYPTLLGAAGPSGRNAEPGGAGRFGCASSGRKAEPCERTGEGETVGGFLGGETRGRARS